MKCFETFNKSLEKKNVKAVITCLNINKPFKDIESLRKEISHIVSKRGIIDLNIVGNIVFIGNEPIGENYILYRFRMFLKNRSEYVGVRVVVENNTIYSITFVIGKDVPYRRVSRKFEEPKLTMKSLISGKVPQGQRYIPNFIIYRVLGQPKVDIEKWKLTIEGYVKRKLEYSYNELLNMEHTRLTADFHCVTGWSVRNIVWEGIQLKKLVGENNVLPNAKWVYVESLDEYIVVIPIADFLNEKSMLVLKINGKILSLEQGFPARIFIPHLYGWKGAKWVTRIVLTDKYVDGFWESLGYHPRGNVWLEERFK